MFSIFRRVGKTGDWLKDRPIIFALYATFAAFSAYFCMYAFRKPFSAATYEGAELNLAFAGFGLEPKTLFVLSQIFGYCLSKYLGTKVCSEIRHESLGRAMLLAIGVSWLALLGFAVLPPAFKVLAIFANGVPLGMVWGLVVRFLEGRRMSELLLAGLSCSYILASGEVKRVAVWLMELGVEEFWMPFVAGALFIVPFALATGLLVLLPRPDQLDEDLRSKREPMDGGQRLAFVRRFLPGVVLLCAAYIALTAYRDFRDNYQIELFLEMGITDAAAFSRTERPIAFTVMFMMALIFVIRNNRWGLAVTYLIMIGGLALMSGSTWAFERGAIDGETWMICSGLGVYLAYVPFGSVLFERIIAVTRFAGTAVFAIYLADALGYTGAVGIQLYKDLFAAEATRLEFFRVFTWAISLAGVPMLILSMVYFLRQRPDPEGGGIPTARPLN